MVLNVTFRKQEDNTRDSVSKLYLPQPVEMTLNEKYRGQRMKWTKSGSAPPTGRSFKRIHSHSCSLSRFYFDFKTWKRWSQLGSSSPYLATHSASALTHCFIQTLAEQPVCWTSTTAERDQKRTSPSTPLKICQWQAAFPCSRWELGLVPGPLSSLLGNQSQFKS